MSDATPSLVPALDYRQLRLLAECSLSLSTSGPASFVFQPDGTLALVSPDQESLADGVLVPTTTPGKYPPLTYVSLQATTVTDNVQHVSVRDVVPLHADAVFWSPGAVEKFVVPYYASCSGNRAVEALTTLRGVWNDYPHEARVMALVHTTRPVAPDVSVASVPVEPMWVVFVNEQNDLDALPLSEFAGKYPPASTVRGEDGGVGESPRVPYQRPSLPAAGLPHYRALRGMAEWAASFKNHTMYFAFDPATGEFRTPTPTMPPVTGGEIVIPIYNAALTPGRVPPDGVWFQPPGNAAPIDLAGVADSVFWSSGAIEQFLLPYYASVDGFAGITELKRIYEAWVLDVLAPLGGDAVGGTETEGPGEVYGLVHLPKSAWMEVEEASSTGLASRELGMVHVPSRSGRTRVTSAAAFHRRYQANG
jgi:hypothetical protein